MTPRRAFTLLELLLVMLILAALALFVGPSAAGSRDRRSVEATARQALALCRLARARAAGEGRVYHLRVDAQELALERARDPLLAPDDPDFPEREAPREDESWSRPFVCAEEVVLIAAEHEGLLVETPLLIAFRPDGESDQAWLVWQAGDDRLALRIDPRLGRARIEEAP